MKRDGRYDYDKLGVMSVSALLPLFFGGSVGPEAGLTGAVAGICTWVGDRMKRFGSDFQQLTSVGTMAALSAIFTAPLFGFAAPLYDDGDEAKGAQAAITLPKSSKIVVYLCAIAGALAAFLGLGALFGGGLSLPRFTDIHVGATELLWLVPLALVGAAGGWLFCAFDGLFERLSERMGERPVAKALIAGLVLALMGIALPFTMFAGETQAEQLGEVWGVMRQPLMTVLLLFLCFPVKGIVVMLAAAALGAAVPLPKALRAEQAEG